MKALFLILAALVLAACKASASDPPTTVELGGVFDRLQQVERRLERMEALETAPTLTPALTSEPLTTHASLSISATNAFTVQPDPDSPPDIVLTGEGGEGAYAGPIRLESGVAIIDMVHEGSGHFIISGVGLRKAIFLNTVGKYNGQRLFSPLCRKNDCSIYVEASGKWTITIKQPRWSSAPTPPFVFRGTRDSVVGPIRLEEGVTRISMSHEGSGKFMFSGAPTTSDMRLISGGGSRSVDVQVSKDGWQFSCRLCVRGSPIRKPGFGLYAVTVTTPGPWEVFIEEAPRQTAETN